MRTLPGSTQRRLRSRAALFVSAALSAALVIGAGCATMETTVVADPGVAFSLPAGKTATVNGNNARITFNRVAEDSRCAVDVVCVWAGDAKIEVTISREGSATQTRTLSLTAPNNEIISGDLKIRFVALAPAPKQSEPSASRAYVAQLVVTPSDQ